MKQCPFCAELTQDEAKVCWHCKAELVKTCPFCAEEISVLAKKCKHCGSDLAKKAEQKAEERTESISAYIGPERNIILQIILCFITCGIYFYFVLYYVGKDIKQHYLKSKIDPGRDILIMVIGSLVTFAFSITIILIPVAILVSIGILIYFIYIMYTYAKDAYNMAVEENMPATNQTVLCIVLAILLGFLAPIVIQHELNKHWQLHKQKT